MRRKPKQLDADPTVFDVAGSSAGLVLRPQPGRSAGSGARRPTGSGAGFTDDPASVIPLSDEDPQLDPVVRARAAQIAARLSVPKPKVDTARDRGSGHFASVPYRGGSDDIDLDQTLEMLAEHPVPDDEDIIVRERVRARRSVVLAVDVSGSMKGERVRTAAATVGALAAEIGQGGHDALAVIAFWSDAAVLQRLGDPVRPMELLDEMLRIPARGLTNIAFPLQLAATQLAGVPPRNARVILLSDCVHNAGPDPRPFAGRLPRLDVLLDTSGEKDVELGRELARIGRGGFHAIRTFHDIAPALGELFRT
ncbi:VWA domain-containing protein [Herbiconiux sp. CPCC 205763]|uniref:VWA domain-containing protein n=1 Tax=Herbiconiux aconitum TaxID=2970913 RepID=A0ABT2GUR8_9MICO|nr:vWA domain-containing protein [Herbiconiux aconitum]MCS5719953.1 VWA domain-containing protein [Herbiconiux aconitum]